MNSSAHDPLVLTREIAASPSHVWELWTTPDGIARWWSPDGFRTDVSTIEPVEGGDLVYTMTAVDQAQVAFMQQNGLPLATESRKRFTAVDRPRRLSYVSVIDFVPGVEPYEHLTTVDLESSSLGTKVTMRIERMHDEEWTQRILDGRSNELDNLAALVTSGHP
jgi:uncharacterized protein YndB with AHSA1/START domain